jgi:hypothetical protein
VSRFSWYGNLKDEIDEVSEHASGLGLRPQYKYVRNIIFVKRIVPHEAFKKCQKENASGKRCEAEGFYVVIVATTHIHNNLRALRVPTAQQRADTYQVSRV